MVGGVGTQLLINNVNAGVSDADSTAVEITGNNTVASLAGEINVGNGARGIVISGDNTSTTATLAGVINVASGGRGIVINGSNSNTSTAATINVQDATSVGIEINAPNTDPDAKTTVGNTGDINVKLNGTGALISSDHAAVTLNGNVNVTGVADAANVMQGGTGVSVIGNNGTVRLDGNVNIGMILPADVVPTHVVAVVPGVSVSGNNNQVVVAGQINLDQEGQVNSVAEDGYNWRGLMVTGAGNNVTVQGGINVRVNSPVYNEAILQQGIYIDGANSVTLSGTSSVYNNIGMLEQTALAYVVGGGHLQLDANAKVAITSLTPLAPGGNVNLPVFVAVGTDSVVSNAGIIDETGSSEPGRVLRAYSWGHLENTETGQIIGRRTAASSTHSGYMMRADNLGTATNSGLLDVKSGMNSFSVVTLGLSADTASVTNTATGRIVMAGMALYGMEAFGNTARALNQGTISLDGFIQTDSGKTAVTTSDKTSSQRGAAISSSVTGAQATNTGSVLVSNSGYGMLATNGGTVINQGQITLSADPETVADGTATQVVGMGAFGGGTAINDTTGVITINSSIARAFYNDGAAGSLIVNNGRIILGDGSTRRPTTALPPRCSNTPMAACWPRPRPPPPCRRRWVHHMPPAARSMSAMPVR